MDTRKSSKQPAQTRASAAKLTEDQYQIYLAAINELEQIRSLSEDEKYDLLERILSATHIDLLCDWAFKHVFGHNPENLMLLLNDFLPERIAAVEEIHMEPNEVDPWKGGDRHVIMDVLCRLEDGRSIIVEMQKSKNAEFRDRMLYYGASMISHQLERGESYSKLRPVYVICFMNFRLKHETDQLVYRYQMREQDTGERYGNLMKIFFCELPRFVKIEGQKMSAIEQWFEMLKNMTTFATRPEDIDRKYDPIFESSRQSVLDDKNRLQYVKAMIFEEDIPGIAKAYYEDGLEDGLEQVARRMLAKGYPVETVADLTGLSEEQVLALKQTS